MSRSSSIATDAPGPIRLSRKRLATAARYSLYAWAAVLAVLWALFTLRESIRTGSFGFDFEGTLWDPALAILDGRSPYPDANVNEVEVGNPALYPPLLMLVVAPLTALPWSVAVVLWAALLWTAVAATLYLLNVRDVRCYVLALVAPFTLSGVTFGNATLLLVPLVALAWRWRDRPARTGAIVGLTIAAKLFLWPLLFWLLGTRRYRAFGVAVIAALALVFVPWAVIGFAGLASYPDLLRLAEELYAVHSNSVATVLAGLGADTQLASRGTLALGLAVAAIAFYVGRRRADASSVSLALLAAILGSPIVWPYYHAFLLIPVALAFPRLAGVWAAFTLFYVADRLPRDILEAEDLAPGGFACCRPEDVPEAVWVYNHSPPGLWPAAAYVALAVAIVGVSLVSSRGWLSRRREEARDQADD